MYPHSRYENKLDPQCKLFIGGLSYETTDESLAAYFSRFGEIGQAAVMRDADTGRSRGFGFVTFRTQDSAAEALRATHHIVDGRKVESKFAVPRNRPTTPSTTATTSSVASTAAPVAPPPVAPVAAPKQQQQQRESPNFDDGLMLLHMQDFPGTPQHPQHRPSISPFPQDVQLAGSGGSGGEIVNNKIFVGGLKYATNAEMLKTFFEDMFGEVESAQIILNRDTKKSRGFGFVIFKNTRSVDLVLARQQATPLMIEGKQVEVRACTARHTMLPQTPIRLPIDTSLATATASSPSSSSASSSATTVPTASAAAPAPIAALPQQMPPQHFHNSPWTPLMPATTTTTSHNGRMSFESPPSMVAASSFSSNSSSGLTNAFPIFKPQASYTPRPLFPPHHQQQQGPFQQQQGLMPSMGNPDLGLFDMSLVGNQLPSSPSFSASTFRAPAMRQQGEHELLFVDSVFGTSSSSSPPLTDNSLFAAPPADIFTSPRKPQPQQQQQQQQKASNNSPRTELARSPVLGNGSSNGLSSFAPFGTQTIW